MASSITEGGYNFDFITDLPEDLTCVLCHFAFKNPVQIEECGHKFCKQCFDNMKDHAESTCVELLCPLDRKNIDVTRVFKDKCDERRVLNLLVKCRNFGDKCDWTGELREALEHETKCCKEETMLNNPFEAEFKQLMNRMTELEVKVKVHERKLVEKDTQIINQTNQILHLNSHNANQDKQIVDQAKAIEDQKTRMVDLERQNANQNKQIVDLNRHTENQEKQIGNLNKQILNQNKQIADQKEQIQSLTNAVNHQPLSTAPLSMIIPNIEDESNYSPICTAFQWKFNPIEVKSGIAKTSLPFYNVMNSYCFQLTIQFIDNNFCISLHRYRGKYDDNVKEIKTSKDFDFQIHICGKNGKLKIFDYENDSDYTIAKHSFVSKGYWEQINNGEIGSLTVDGYVHLHCFFKNTN